MEWGWCTERKVSSPPPVWLVCILTFGFARTPNVALAYIPSHIAYIVIVYGLVASEVVEYEKSHNSVTAVPDGYFEQALAAEKAAVEDLSKVAAAGGAEVSSGSNLTAHESISSRQDRQVMNVAAMPLRVE